MSQEPPGGSGSDQPLDPLPSKPGQGSSPERFLEDLRSVPTGKPSTPVGKLTYELRKTEIAAEIRREEIRAQIRLAEIAEGGDDKEHERNTQVLLDKQRNRMLIAITLGVGVIALSAVGYWFGKDPAFHAFGISFGGKAQEERRAPETQPEETDAAKEPNP